MEKRTVYLDNNATTPLHPAVKEKIKEYLDYFGNPSSVYTIGREANFLLNQARQYAADFLNALPNEIIFTSCGSESNNTVLKSCARNVKKNGKKHFITSKIEHPAILHTLELMKRDDDVDVTYLDVDSYGLVNPEDLEKAIRPETVLVTVMFANNEIGTIEPVEKLCEIAHKHGVLFHTDAVQAAGKVRINLAEMPFDFLSISGHKVYAPKGVGILFARNNVKDIIYPLIAGGHQENAIRAGTENMLGIIALGEALRVLKDEMPSEAAETLRLRKRLEAGLLSIPHTKLNGHPELRVPGCVNVSFDSIEGESILLRLDLMGISVSTGSACSSGSLDPSPVIMAIGNNPERAHGSIRFSLGRENTEADIDYTIAAVKDVVETLRKISPIKLD
ncbi:MAG: cysteine desulfurase [Spirochaetales bacterium]|nr:cysteine desulfurase [Spirochaetales bacterium]